MFATINLVLSPESPQARALSELFIVTLGVCAVIFLIVIGLIVWCVIHFRNTDDSVVPQQTAGNTKLEVSWTIASILALIFLFVLTVQAMRIADPPMDREADITVIGHQWWWEVRYANGLVTANEIHIPIQSNVLVAVDSADVIHNFWIPQWGRKMDAIPGHPNHLWIRSDQAGEYFGTCGEFCGAQHAGMHLLGLAQSPDEFRDWLAQQTRFASVPASPEALRGRQFFLEKTCVQCHSIRGVNPLNRVGPDFTHFASRQTIGAGVLPNNPANLKRWLTDPQQIKPGCYMPNFHLTSAEVEDLTAFLETLK